MTTTTKGNAMTTTDPGRETLDALNLVTDNDWSASCARLRLVLDAGTDAFDGRETSDDPGSVPAWQVAAADALRDWYRDHMIPLALDAAEERLRMEWRARMTNQRSFGARLPGDDPRDAGGSWVDSLPNAAATMLRALATDALDGIPWAAWLDDVGELAPREGSDDGHEWLFDAFRILPTLRTENPREPAGEWCVYDLAVALAGGDDENGIGPTNDELRRVSAALAGLEYHGIAASRYVGGTSGTLHHLRPAATRIAAD